MKRDPATYVDQTIDTAKPRIRWVFSVGTARPTGLVRLSPNTDPVGTWDSGYRYGSNRITCFSHLHSWQVAGVPVMPTMAVCSKGGFDRYASSFRHESETWEPGYYAVHLDDAGIDAELTATRRVGFHRYRFGSTTTQALVFDLCAELGPAAMADAELRQTGPTRIEGYVENEATVRRKRRVRIYFAGELNRSIRSKTPIAPSPAERDGGTGAGAYLELEPDEGPLLLKVGISFTSVEGARRNLHSELPGWDFDAVRREAWAEWNEVLGRIRVDGGTEEDTVKLYTDLFRVLSAPQTMSDFDGRYCHASDGKPRILETERDGEGRPAHPQICGHDGFWNSQWSTNLVLSLAYPKLFSDGCRFLIDFYRDGGLIPRGPSAGTYTFVMIAAPTTPFIVSAWMKGIRDFDIEHAYAGMVKNSLPGGLMAKAGYEAFTAEGGGIEDYLDRGYIPAGRKVEGAMHTDGAAQTLEYAFQDWSLARLAEAMGKKRDAEVYQGRSRNYRNLFDTTTGFMRPRLADGSLLEPFDPLSLEDFCEANSWQYSFHVMQDMNDLISLMGGEARFVERLDQAFRRAEPMSFYAPKPALERNRAYINYGNEPGRYVAHLFAHAGAPWLTQKWSREVKRRTFGAITPLGYCEDDDIGKAAATSLLLSIGLFDIRGGCAREPIYEITAPVFQRVTIDLDNRYYPGGRFTIEVDGDPSRHAYIQEISLDGRPIDRLWISHDEYAAGGTLSMRVGPEPNRSLGTRGDARLPV